MTEQSLNQFGPHVRRLIARKMAIDAPRGMAGALDFLMSKEKMSSGAKAAAEWVRQACEWVREAEEPNDFKHHSDEQIAEYLLQQINIREAKP